MSKVSVLLLLAISAFALTLESCQPTCTLPTQSFAEVRIVNAVSNVDKIDLYLDGKIFTSSFYKLTANGTLGTDDFGYVSQFSKDKTALQPGTHHIVARRSSDNALLVDTTLLLKDHRQSLLFIGRMEGTPSEKPQLRYLDDAVRARDDKKSLVRFVHAVPDLSGLDVYFSASVKRVGGKAKPDLVLRYGEISDTSGKGIGTGKLATDYFSIPIIGTDGLLITGAGDTSKIVVRIPYPFATAGFLATVVIRGQSAPVCDEHAVSTIAIEDGQQGNGTYNLDNQIYGIRLCNATRDDSLSLLMLGPSDDKQYGPRSTRNTPVPLQERVLQVPRGSVGRDRDSQQYMPVDPGYHGTCDFWLGISDQEINSSLAPGDTIFHFKDTSFADQRFTIIGIERTPLNSGTSMPGVIQLRDTLCNPIDPSFSRVRFVNASPDHTMNFTFGGSSHTLRQTEIDIADEPVGHKTLTLSDGATTGILDFDLPSRIPITVILLPATATNPFPYVVAKR